jgi:hypothetical protein
MYSEAEPHNFWTRPSTAQLRYDNSSNWPSTKSESKNVPENENLKISVNMDKWVRYLTNFNTNSMLEVSNQDSDIFFTIMNCQVIAV